MFFYLYGDTKYWGDGLWRETCFTPTKHEIKEIVENSVLEKKIKQYEIKLAVFSQLRDAPDTVPRNVHNGLSQMKETGTHKELKTIKRAVAKFKTDLREKITGLIGMLNPGRPGPRPYAIPRR